MIQTFNKRVTVKKWHPCAYCGDWIRAGEKAGWYKNVVIREDGLPNSYYEGYLCEDCRKSLDDDMAEAAKEAAE